MKSSLNVSPSISFNWLSLRNLPEFSAHSFQREVTETISFSGDTSTAIKETP